MSRADELVKKLTEFVPLTSYGGLTTKAIEDAFRAKLNSFGYESIQVSAYIDLAEGPLVTFWDIEGDEVTIWFYVNPEEGPIASVVSEDDEQISVDLSTVDCPTFDVNGQDFIDLTDLSWMNKSTLTVLLAAGEVDESFQEALNKMVVTVGGKKRKLPVVVKKDQMSDVDKAVLDRAKAMGKKVDTNKKFSDRIKNG